MLHPLDNPEYFTVYEVRILRKLVGSGLRVRRKAYAMNLPNGQVYISQSGSPGTSNIGRVCYTSAVEGVDFERI